MSFFFGWGGGFANCSIAEARAYMSRVRSLRVFGDMENAKDWDVREWVEFNT